VAKAGVVATREDGIERGPGSWSARSNEGDASKSRAGP